MTVEISYLTATGAGNVAFSDTIAASSRKSYSMGTRLAGTRASVVVRSRTPGRPIMVERAMYWNNRAEGTDSIGGCGD